MFLSLDGGSVHPPRTRQTKHLTQKTKTHTHTHTKDHIPRTISQLHACSMAPARPRSYIQALDIDVIIFLICFHVLFCLFDLLRQLKTRWRPKVPGLAKYLFVPTLILIHIHILTYVFVFVQGGQFTAPGAPWAGRYSTTNTNVIRCSSRRVS